MLQNSREAARPGKFANNRIRLAESKNQNSQFGRGGRKLFYVPGPKKVLQHIPPDSRQSADIPACRKGPSACLLDVNCRRLLPSACVSWVMSVGTVPRWGGLRWHLPNRLKF